ncbi:putative ribonuclease H-like domain-containing protein [Tanacetum coccineum]|uniref:Ribonuclease H-like domain-containing protein n=1 Tax=Tanacetum coccineum TaxID=301880 RepID=A0ABQ4WLY4_9ASTR
MFPSLHNSIYPTTHDDEDLLQIDEDSYGRNLTFDGNGYDNCEENRANGVVMKKGIVAIEDSNHKSHGFGVESSSGMESDNSSGNTNSTDSLYSNFQKTKGFHSVPPPTGTIIPPRANVSFTGIDELAIRNKSNHLIQDCNLHERTSNKTQTSKPKEHRVLRDKDSFGTIQRVNHSNFSRNSRYPHQRRSFIPSAVLTREGLKSTARPKLTRTVPSKSTANVFYQGTARPKVPHAVLSQSTGRPYYPRMDNTRPRTSSFSRTPHRPQRPKKIVKSIWVKKGSTVGTQAVLPQTVKESAMMKSNQTWRPKGAYLDSVNRDNGSYTLKQFEYGNPEEDLKDYAIIDSGCSGSMTGDKDKLSDFKEEGVDYDEVFAPVARIEAIRLFLAFASFMGFTVYQMDVKSAFLYGNITEEVYVKQPPGFEDPAHPNKVYRVVKALYGLHQAPRAWYERLSTFLLKHGYRRGAIDKTLFIKKDRRDIMLVQVYVDDIIFGSTKPSMVKDFEDLMQKEFKMSSMGELTFFLGLQVKQTSAGIFLSQDKYVKDILNKFDFRTIKPASTPIEAHKSLGKDEEGEDVDVHLYRSMIGCLMYLTASRPDIMFAVCLCARFQVTPKVSHLHAVKRIFRYLKHQPNLGLWYPKDSPFHLEAFSDSDYAGDNHDRRSTSGGCQYLGRRLVSWQCKKQTIVAISSTEAEYVAAASCCAQVLWMQNQLLDYGFNFMNTEIHIDNESTICIVKNPVFHSKTKHIQIRHHFIRDCYEQRLINVVKVHTDDNVADLLTKGFDLARFNFLVVTIGMMNP